MTRDELDTENPRTASKPELPPSSVALACLAITAAMIAYAKCRSKLRLIWRSDR